MAASGKPGWDALFPPYPPGFVRVAFGSAEAVRRAIGPQTAAILVEPIRGRPG
jgi:acetylornithine/N-succinyldiaminopimelate aminotransferase